MKYIKSYTEQSNFCNESIKDFLKPKSEEEIMKKIENLSTVDKLKKTCEFGYNSVVKDILDKTEPEHILEYKLIALYYSVLYNNNEIVKFLLNDKNLDLSFFQEDPDWCLVRASESGNIELVKFLLNDERFNPSYMDYTPFHVAVHGNKIDIVKLYLQDQRVNPISTRNNALRVSIDKGYKELTQLLLNDDRVKKSILP